MNRSQLQAFLEEFEKSPPGTPVIAGQLALVLTAILADEDGLTLPGWTCGACKGFNGEAKEALNVCRGCGAAKP